MTSLGALTVRIGADLSSLHKAFSQAEGATVKLGRQMQSVGKSMSMFVSAPIIALGAVAVANFDKQAKAIAAVENGLRNVGSTVGFTSKQFQDMASGIQSNTLFGDEDILQKVTANLLTFGGIAGDVFERAQVSAVNLSARLGQDLQSSAIMLGKAMANPVQGITAMTRVGVVFTAEQKEMVKQMVATGRAAEAQNLILSEVEKYYGGAAEAAAKAGTGPMKQFMMSLGDLTESFGRLILIGLNPIINMLNDLVAVVNGLPGPWKAAIVVVAGLAAAMGPLLVGLGTALVVLPKVKAALLAVNRATVMLTLKIIAITAAVAVFAGAAYLIYKNWSGVKAFFVTLWKDVVAATTSAMGLVQARVEGAFLRLIRTMSGLGAKLLEPARRVASGLGADGLAEQISGAQLGIENIVSESAVSAVEARAGRLASSLTSAARGMGATFSSAGRAIGADLSAMAAQASSAFAQTTLDVEDVGDAAGEAAAGVGAASGEMVRQLDTVVVQARRVRTAIDRIAASASALRELPMRDLFRKGKKASRDEDLIAPTFGGLQDFEPVALSDDVFALSQEYQFAFDQIRSTVDGVAYAIGDAAAQLFQWRNPIESIKAAFQALGQGIGRVFQNVVADITAAIARMAILQGLLMLTGPAGFLGGALSALAGSAKMGAGAAGGMALSLSMQPGELRMSHGYVLASVRAGLMEEQRTGRGPGVL